MPINVTILPAAQIGILTNPQASVGIVTNPPASVGITTTSYATLTLSMGVPGPKGDAGTIEVGTVSTVPYGVPANVTNSGTNYAAILNFTIPTGPQGATGATGSAGQAATISVGSVNTLPAGSSATVTNAGSSSAAVFNFGIPQGLQGVAGTNGTNGTNGVGVPSGGSTNQVLAKIDGANYNTQWITLPSAPVTSVAEIGRAHV